MGANASVLALSLTEWSLLFKAGANPISSCQRFIHIGVSGFDCSIGAVE
jgi:hypothetical protein